MKDDTRSGRLVVPRLTIDPDLPVAAKEMLRAAKPAELLRAYSRVERSTLTKATGDEARPVLQARQAVLRTALDGIERRVAALETYAEQTAEADRRYAGLLQIQKITTTGDELLELLAHSVRDDLAAPAAV
ncbi:hypothetical protein [Streptomyces sp. CAU 1734]|uniref:hypothetical protein n=1 Tax=Streptomyces sp. CAU 1734 TaxID=3140360 RepID=UPI003261977E